MQLNDYEFLSAFANRFTLIKMPARGPYDPPGGIAVFMVADSLFLKISYCSGDNDCYFVDFSRYTSPFAFEESTAWLISDGNGKIIKCAPYSIEDTSNHWFENIPLSTYWPFDVEQKK
jgi:hypothetical protein